MKKIAFNDQWLFTRQWEDRLISLSEKETGELTPVRLPHTVTLLPFNNCDPNDYQMVSGYVRYFSVPEEWQGKRVFIRFDGAAHQAEVYCNGQLLGSHHCGYTAFCLELTDSLR